MLSLAKVLASSSCYKLMEIKMNRYLVIVLCTAFLIIGCSNGESSNTQSDYKRQVEEYDAQTKHINQQMAEYDAQMRKGQEQLEKAELQMKKAEAQQGQYGDLLDRWKKQADRYDLILDKWEKQIGPKK